MLCTVPSKPTSVAESTKHLAINAERDLNLANEITTNCKIDRGTILQVMHFTDLLELPKNFGQCRQVVNLSVDNNYNLTHIPEEIEEMRMLERANFSYNRLLKFPEGLVKLKMLTYLDLSNNEIHSVHRDINNMKALEVLILDNNFITSFPPGLTYLTHLRRLSVLNNPLVTEEMKVDRVEDAVIPPEQKEEHCMICHSVLTDKPRPVYNFVDIGGVKNVPILYVVRDEKCQAVVAELADSEMQTFSTLVYD